LIRKEKTDDAGKPKESGTFGERSLEGENVWESNTKESNTLNASNADIKKFDESKKLTDVHKKGNSWVVTNKEGKVVKEYEVGLHRQLTKDGTRGFFQSHHGIQDKWAEVKFKSFCEKHGLNNPYSRNDCPTINLRDSMKGSPHRNVTDLQASRKSLRDSYDYQSMRNHVLTDMTAANVPFKFQNKLISESDIYFKNLYDDLFNQLSSKGYSSSKAKNVLKEIFGDFKF